MSGAGRGRRRRTEQVNWSLVLRLAGEFQGFARDLHSEAAAVVQHETATTNPKLAAVLARLLTQNRQLDRTNAQPGSLGADFARFGMDLWPNLQAASLRAERWQSELASLNETRNGIAHANLEGMAGTGYAVRLADNQSLEEVDEWTSKRHGPGFSTVFSSTIVDSSPLVRSGKDGSG